MTRKHAFNLWRDKGNKWRGGHTPLDHWEERFYCVEEEREARQDILSRLEGTGTLPAYPLVMIQGESQTDAWINSHPFAHLPRYFAPVENPKKSRMKKPHTILPWEDGDD